MFSCSLQTRTQPASHRVPNQPGRMSNGGLFIDTQVKLYGSNSISNIVCAAGDQEDIIFAEYVRVFESDKCKEKALIVTHSFIHFLYKGVSSKRNFMKHLSVGKPSKLEATTNHYIPPISLSSLQRLSRSPFDDEFVVLHAAGSTDVVLLSAHHEQLVQTLNMAYANASGQVLDVLVQSHVITACLGKQKMLSLKYAQHRTTTKVDWTQGANGVITVIVPEDASAVTSSSLLESSCSTESSPLPFPSLAESVTPSDSMRSDDAMTDTTETESNQGEAEVKSTPTVVELQVRLGSVDLSDKGMVDSPSWFRGVKSRGAQIQRPLGIYLDIETAMYKSQRVKDVVQGTAASKGQSIQSILRASGDDTTILFAAFVELIYDDGKAHQKLLVVTDCRIHVLHKSKPIHQTPPIPFEALKFISMSVYNDDFTALHLHTGDGLLIHCAKKFEMVECVLMSYSNELGNLLEIHFLEHVLFLEVNKGKGKLVVQFTEMEEVTESRWEVIGRNYMGADTMLQVHAPPNPKSKEQERIEAEQASMDDPGSASGRVSAELLRADVAAPGVPVMNVAILVTGTFGDVLPFIALAKEMQVRRQGDVLPFIALTKEMQVRRQGDVLPFIALAKEMQRYGHRVRLATHRMHRAHVVNEGIEFYPLEGDPKKLSEWMVKAEGRLVPKLEKEELSVVPEKMRMVNDILNSCWPACSQRDPEGDPAAPAFIADAIISNPVTYGHMHCAEALSIPLHLMFPQPWTPTTAFPHPFAGMSYQGKANSKNWLSYQMVDAMMWTGVGSAVNKFRREVLQLPPILLNGASLLNSNKVPFSKMWSEAVLPKPKDWGPHISVVGNFFYDRASSYSPPEELKQWLESGDLPVFVGFGSMVIDNTAKLMDAIVQAAKGTGTRVLVQSSWSKLEAAEDAAGEADGAQLVHSLGNCPHDWLFPRTCAVIHHGGAGTLAAGLRYGKPTLVCPFFGDQYLWGEYVWRSGAGVKPCPIKSLSPAILAEAFTQLRSPEMRDRAVDIAQQFAEEDGVKNGLAEFHKQLPVDDMARLLHSLPFTLRHGTHRPPALPALHPSLQDAQASCTPCPSPLRYRTHRPPALPALHPSLQEAQASCAPALHPSLQESHAPALLPFILRYRTHTPPARPALHPSLQESHLLRSLPFTLRCRITRSCAPCPSPFAAGITHRLHSLPFTLRYRNHTPPALPALHPSLQEAQASCTPCPSPFAAGITRLLRSLPFTLRCRKHTLLHSLPSTLRYRTHRPPALPALHPSLQESHASCAPCPSPFAAGITHRLRSCLTLLRAAGISHPPALPALRPSLQESQGLLRSLPPSPSLQESHASCAPCPSPFATGITRSCTPALHLFRCRTHRPPAPPSALHPSLQDAQASAPLPFTLRYRKHTLLRSLPFTPRKAGSTRLLRSLPFTLRYRTHRPPAPPASLLLAAGIARLLHSCLHPSLQESHASCTPCSFTPSRYRKHTPPALPALHPFFAAGITRSCAPCLHPSRRIARPALPALHPSLQESHAPALPALHLRV
ncbi:hypothetical protein CYMTET_53782 [Cymbomonas tetramitiformis]|uniref:TH1 domain-containing protein n=1 Tax=Cymbomonas tetramitiformis TaxID=36881 RepID=A0AAE0BG70_9CHLO|nr:hypothetical protein CYMTET_53782 [Cymbomonas tetramitiformis]